jgi:hypothetical protein
MPDFSYLPLFDYPSIMRHRVMSWCSPSCNSLHPALAVSLLGPSTILFLSVLNLYTSLKCDRLGVTAIWNPPACLGMDSWFATDIEVLVIWKVKYRFWCYWIHEDILVFLRTEGGVTHHTGNFHFHHRMRFWSLWCAVAGIRPNSSVGRSLQL